MIKNIIFDLDGTLIDSSADLRNAIKKAYLQLGMDIFVPLTVIGLPIKDIVQQLTPELEPSKIIPIFRKLYDESDFPSTRLCKGIEKVKSFFPTSYLLTNKPTKPTLRILEKFQLKFKKVVCVDTYPEFIGVNKKENLAWLMNNGNMCPIQTIMIGDTEHDILAANGSNIDSIIVMNGYGDKKKIAELKPYRTCASLNEVYSILREEVQ